MCCLISLVSLARASQVDQITHQAAAIMQASGKWIMTSALSWLLLTGGLNRNLAPPDTEHGKGGQVGFF